jgi:pimeloyl-ACP methyl ester carboxylesterase
VLLQSTGPDQRQKLVLLEPSASPHSPRPGAVVPYYRPDLMAGFDLDERSRIEERPNVQFGRHLARRGFVVVCTEAYPYNTVPKPDSDVTFDWWRAATEKLLAENPRWTGIGKLTWDTSRAVDLLLAQPDVDEGRVLAIGHSLGGKMSFYTAAFDERITACIASDFGIAWEFTNWDAPWYFGEQIHEDDFTLNGHHALALIAPRSFLCIAGEADRPESWHYIREAQRVYRLYERGHAAGCFLHMTGHQPTEEAVETAYAWLDEQFGLP